MARESRESRLRQFLDEMTHQMLRSLGVIVGARVTSQATKDELIDTLAEVSLIELRWGLADGIAHKDLRGLCTRLGYSDAGSPAKLATRLIEAVETPNARITRWQTFDEARAFARKLQLHSAKQWFQFTRGELPEKGERPDDIPVAPLEVLIAMERYPRISRSQLIARLRAHARELATVLGALPLRVVGTTEHRRLP